MINELDETIKQLLIKKGGIDPGSVDIEFKIPDREWSASVSKPTINVYLYDIRENHQLRGTEFSITRDGNGNTTKKKNPSRIDLSYNITVWTSDIADEHHLLWSILATLFRYHELPEDVLNGELREQEYSIKTNAAQPGGLLNNPADFWSALDNEIKPSINYVVTLPLDPAVAFTAPEVKTKVLQFKPPDTEAEKLAQISGVVKEKGQTGKAVPDARIIAMEAGMTTVTDAEGRYIFKKLSPGEHTLEIIIADQKAGEQKITVPGTAYDLAV